MKGETGRLEDKPKKERKKEICNCSSNEIKYECSLVSYNCTARELKQVRYESFQTGIKSNGYAMTGNQMMTVGDMISINPS